MTAFPGNTLSYWLQLLLLPLMVPAILLPALLNWITGPTRPNGPPAPGSPRSRRRQGPMTTPAVGSYLRWKKEVAEHDYTAAASYLSIRFGQDHADQVAAKLRKLPVIMRRANDILRATGREPLGLSDPGVLNDLKKVLAGDKLSPVLVAEGDIADGYHRVSLAYALDPYADIPLKIG